MEIFRPGRPEEFDAVRGLCWEYRDFLLGLDVANAAFVSKAYPEEKYAALMEALETEHAAPGSIVLARHQGRPVGCGMSRAILPGAVEIKRVYVRPEARGLGAGRAIMDALVAEARQNGFERILMDTGKVLGAAQRLYDEMGFRRRGPYQSMPPEADELMVYYEMAL